MSWCLVDIVQRQAALRGDKVAVQCDSHTLTYADLNRRSDHTASLMVEQGVMPGDRVGWLGRGQEGFFEVLFGAAKAGACFTPINSRLTPSEIALILKDSEAKLCFVTPEYHGVAEAAIALVSRPIRIMRLDRARGGVQIGAVLHSLAAGPQPRIVPQPSDDILQIYTSGTTGRPKGVRLTNANYAAYFEMRSQIEGMHYQADEAVLVAMPLFHVAGINISLAGLKAGGRLVLLPEFDPRKALRLIESERVARITLAPAMINMCLQAPEIETTDMSSLKSVAYGASPIAESVLTEATKRFGCGFVQIYGLTETAAAGTYLPPSAHTSELLRSCGKPWPMLQMAVLDEAGNEVTPGAIGEIVIRGAVVMAGYWNQPEATAEAFTQNGWLRTGDAGFCNTEGYYFVCDRVKDLIVSGGENVYPAEVENAIMGCPGVADVAVIGVPDDRWGESVKALIVPAPGTVVDPADIIAWVRRRIAGYKAPKSVDFLATLPRNTAGKILRRELRKLYWEGRDRHIG